MVEKHNYTKYLAIFEVYVSIILVLIVRLPYIILIFISNILVYAYMKHSSSKTTYQIDKESMLIIDSMLTNYSEFKSTIEILSLSINRNWLVCGSINKGLDVYQMSGDISSFDVVNRSNSKRFGMVILLIKKCIVSRACLYPDLINLKEIFLKEDTYNLKNYGLVKNGLLIVNLGTLIFFPVFAGIGFNVIKFAGLKLNNLDSYFILLIISTYLIIANYINFRYSKSENLIRIFNIGIASFTALSVLRIVILASGFMLR